MEVDAVAAANRHADPAHEKVFLTHVGPIALRAVKKQALKIAASDPAMPENTENPLVAPVEHVIAFDYEKTRPNVVKALAIGSAAATQPGGAQGGLITRPRR